MRGRRGRVWSHSLVRCIGEVELRSSREFLDLCVSDVYSQFNSCSDVKELNFLVPVEEDGHLSLADFGHAVHVDDEDAPEGERGTPGWRAPEMPEHPSTAADLYSVGCVLISLIGLRHVPNVLRKLAPGDLEFLFGPSVAKVLRVVLRHDPKERGSVKELIGALENSNQSWLATLRAVVPPEPGVIANYGALNDDAPYLRMLNFQSR